MNIHASSSRVSYLDVAMTIHVVAKYIQQPKRPRSFMARLVSNFSPPLPYFPRPVWSVRLVYRLESIGLPFPSSSERLASTSTINILLPLVARPSISRHARSWLHRPPTPPNPSGRFACSPTKSAQSATISPITGPEPFETSTTTRATNTPRLALVLAAATVH
jgi:hypothetical protein